MTISRTTALARWARSVALAALAASAAIAPAARADVRGRLSHLADLRERIVTARGPLAYVALRTLWTEWDRGDPDGVEEILSGVASDGAEPAPVQVYAGLLGAYARRRRGDLEGARAQVAHLGYVADWMLLGPFDDTGKVGLNTEYGPEKEQGLPIVLTRDYDGKDQQLVRWRHLPAVSPYGWSDFGVFVRPEQESCVYAVTFVRDERVKGRAAHEAASIWAGAAGGLRVFWNDTEVIRDDKYRDLEGERFAATVDVREGWNRVMAKVCGDDRAPMLSLRVAGPDGAPDAHLQIDADPRHSTHEGGAAVSDAAKAGGGVRPATHGSLEGAVQAFERLTKGEDPAMLEAYARYLVMTASDDPSEHRARTLASKAAEKSPTIPRLLLAAEAAESRNQRASGIEQAEAIVAAGHATDADTIDVLLARAAYERSGVNWRDAVPYFDKVLALDPENVAATLAKVELDDAAGLHETGLDVLSRALTRRPRSVALLRATVAALRDQGRETEADEMAERYAALRFDDPALARARIDLAVARRDAASAGRWIDRLVMTNPDSIGALQTAAQAWMRLGDRSRAIAAYDSALDLAPNDTDVMHQLATVYGRAGERDAQLRLLKRVLELMPQAKEIRDEVAHIEPAPPRADEQYARPASEFLAQRGAPAAGYARRSLVDLQVTTVFPNGLANRFYQVVYQPTTDAAAAMAREHEFTYEIDSQTVQLRAARVYRKDGQIDEAVESGAGAMADDPAVAMYTSARTYYVRFPRLEPGDVVELQYRVDDVAPRNAFADYFGEVVTMQSPEPVFRSEYVLRAPASRTLYFNEPRVPNLQRTVQDHGDERVYDFVARDVPPVVSEALQPPWPEVLGHVNVSTYKSWDDMGRWYWGLVRDQFIPDAEVRRKAEELTKAMKDDASKVRAVYDYVSQKTRYVALEFDIHGYKPYSCAQIFARGFGDCKDKATLIVTMLGALGIKATPVIVRTGMKGDIETSPASLAPFDHMIAYVPSLDLYLDGTAQYTGSQELPAMDRGAIALQVNEGHVKVVRLPDPPASASVSAHKVEATVGVDGSAQVDWRSDVGGVEASEWRVRFHAEATRKQRVQQLLGSLMPGSEVTSVEANDMEDVEQRVQLHARGKAPEFGRVDDGVLTIPVGPREHMVRDFAPLAERALDVRLQAQSTEEDDWTVHLPPSAKVRSAPSPVQGSSPFGSFQLEVEASGATVHVKTAVTLTRTRIPVADYPAFRAWCEHVDRALGQRVTAAVK